MRSFTHLTVDTMSKKEKSFFRELGERIALLPKAKQCFVLEMLETVLRQAHS